MKVLLFSKEKSFLIDTDQKKFSCQYGLVDLTRIKKYGQRIKTNKGKEFTVLEPTITDLLRKARRLPQIVTPKDAAQIAAVTGAADGWKCLDLGGGSGFLSLFLANIVRPSGSVVTYEKNKQHCDVIKHNIKYCGAGNVTAKNKPAERFTEKGLDLITVDMVGAEKLVKKAHASLKSGGWLAVYSPHIEQQIRTKKEMQKYFTIIKTIETSQKEWKIDPRGFSHPVHSQLVHTGFMTFARKT